MAGAISGRGDCLGVSCLEGEIVAVARAHTARHSSETLRPPRDYLILRKMNVCPLKGLTGQKRCGIGSLSCDRFWRPYDRTFRFQP